MNARSLSNSLTAFLDWAAGIQRDLAAPDSAITVQLCRPTANRAASIRIEMPERLGELIFWEAGSADATVFDEKGGLIDLQKEVALAVGWDAIDVGRFDEVFQPFIQQFAHPSGIDPNA